MSAAHVRRGGAARTKPRKPAKVSVSKKIAKRLPVDHKRANKLAAIVFSAFLLAIGLVVLIALDIPAKAERAAGSVIGKAGFTVSGYQIVGLNHMNRSLIDAVVTDELKPKAGFYDYAAKYTDGLTEHICPAEIPYEITHATMDMAARAHRLLGCRGASRSDFRWDDEQGEAGIYLLEVNTQPGMTPLSLVPEQAKLKGIAYGELVERLIQEALPKGSEQ